MTLARRCGPVPQSSLRALSFDGTDLGAALVQKPDRYAYFERSFPAGGVIARGAGLSYAAASFGRSSVSIDMGSFDRILGLDAERGLIEVEAGARLGEVATLLAARGLYLPVQPGHGGLSIGGCIAADVHGKHQLRDGTFRDQVDALRLFHPDHGIVELSRTSDPEIFDATCGGYGTTGVILSARLRAAVLPAHWVHSQVELIEVLGDWGARLREAAGTSDLLYTWHDFTRSGAAVGRGFLVHGRFAHHGTPGAADAPNFKDRNRLSAAWRASAPRIYSSASLPLLNRLYAKRLAAAAVRTQPLSEALFPLHRSENYFRGFGRRGFHEYQAIVPDDAFPAYFTALHRIVQRAGACAPLASAKLFAGKSRLLQFSGDGICLALNVARTRHSTALLSEFDAVLRDVHGRPNLIKDSRLPMHVVAGSYPGIETFRALLRRWDPARLFRSELTERLQL